MLKIHNNSFWSLLILLAGISLASQKLQAQAVTFSYIFDGLVLTGTSTQAAAATANPATYGAGLGTKTFFTGNPGDAMAADGFASGTPLSTGNNDYFGFSITATACTTVVLTNFSFDGRRSGTGPANLELRSSIDSYGAALYSGTLGGTNFESEGAALANVTIPAGQTVSFRLYGYNATGATGTLRIDNVTFSGTIAGAYPSVFSVTGGGAICPPAGAAVGLSNSQIGVNYQLRYNGSPMGAAVPGTGTTLNFGDQTAQGIYTVVATNANGCTSLQSGSAIISQSPSCGGCSVTLGTTQVNPACFGAATGSIDLSVSGGTAPYTYDWSNDGAENPDNDPQDLNTLTAGTFTVTVTDAIGCTKSASATLSQPSVIALSTTQLNAQCNALGSIDLTVSGGTPGYTYFWSNSATTQDINNLGAGTYFVTVTDANSCTKTSSATIISTNSLQISAIPSHVLCFGGSTGAIDLSVSNGTAPYTYDWSNDGPETPDNDPQDLSGLSAGSYTVTVTDANSCSIATSVNVTQASALNLNASVVNPNNCFVANGSIDLTVSGGTSAYTYDWSNDGPETPDNDPQDLQNLVEGTYTVTVTDANGCSANYTATLDYIDQIAPVITCPANITLPADVNCSGVIGAYTPAFLSDNCTAVPVVVQNPASGSVLSGANASQLIVLRATDEAGNTGTCNFMVTLIDVTKPVLTCPANQTVNTESACSGTVGAWNALSVSDNCSASPAVSQSPVASTALNGHNDFRLVTLTATDATGNTQTCSFTVTLKDATAPSITCPPNVILQADESCNGIIGAYLPLSVGDNCTSTPTVVQNPLASTLLSGHSAIGIVTLTATDGAGNTQSCTLTVTLNDETPPVIFCKPFTTDLNAFGMATIDVNDVFESGFDNCGGVFPKEVSPSSFTCSQIGPRLVTLTASDGNGNSATCSATVTVRDAIAPVAICKNVTTSLNVDGNSSVAAAAVNNGSSDNCSFSLSLSPNTFNCASIGVNPVTLQVTDAGGNTATCTATVSVSDHIGPLAKCKTPTVFLDDTGHGTLTASEVNNGSSDACGISTMSITKTEYNCGELTGINTVRLNLMDVNGNTSSCLASVVVKDAMAPSAYCADVTVHLDANGTAIVYGDELASESFDNCSVVTYSPVATTYKPIHIGTNNLTITVKDFSGNAATCVSVVTVVAYGGPRVMPYRNNLGKDEALQAFKVYPNPTSGVFTVAFELPAEQTVQVRIYDLQGRMLWSQSVLASKGENALPMHLEGFADGLYLLDFESGDQKVQTKLLIQE